jgi:hypothetical protein
MELITIRTRGASVGRQADTTPLLISMTFHATGIARVSSSKVSQLQGMFALKILTWHIGSPVRKVDYKAINAREDDVGA